MLWLFIQCKEGRRTKDERRKSMCSHFHLCFQSMRFEIIVMIMWILKNILFCFYLFTRTNPSFSFSLFYYPSTPWRELCFLAVQMKACFLWFLISWDNLESEWVREKKNENIYQWFAKIKWMRFSYWGWFKED